MMRHLLFSVDQIACALPLASIRIVLQMVQLGPVSESRPGLVGTVNLHGQIIPVYSVRSFFGGPDRAPRLTDKLIIVQAGPDCVALWVDETHVIQQSPVLPPPCRDRGERTTAGSRGKPDREGYISFLRPPPVP
jgi:purine-binding chemotaxis protein CheW